MLLVDTVVFVSAADRDEPSHERCGHLLQANRGQLATTGPVVAETSWMIESRLGPTAESAFVGAVAARRIEVVDLTPALYARCVTLINTYADLGLGLVDASLVAVAEHHKQTRIATSTIATSPSCAPPTPPPLSSSPDPADPAQFVGDDEHHPLPASIYRSPSPPSAQTRPKSEVLAPSPHDYG